MDRHGGFYHHDQLPRFANTSPTTATTLIGGILIVCLAYQVFGTLEFQDWLWNALVALIPARLLLDSATLRAQSTRDGDMYAHRHAAKSEALRKLFGSREQVLRTAIGVAQRARTLSTAGTASTPDPEPTTDAPPGLGNWDNSCYQNSILQGLAALPSLQSYLDLFANGMTNDDTTTAGSLRATIGNLNDSKNNGRHLWTPAKLKSMSSWQQQDAQEYFSKIMDELDKEASKKKFKSEGLRDIIAAAKPDDDKGAEMLGNPLEGLLAQRVACTRCGFSEGISMIPFNCLTVPLGLAHEYNIESCLNEYTGLEEIGEVDCAKCTLLRAEKQLTLLVGDSKESPTTSQIPVEVQQQATKRLEAVRKALDEDDFSDKTIGQTCQISKKAHASSTKTRQAVVGRAPQSLAIHINRSVFDETTGAQRKNYANVRFPSTLDLAPWTVETGWTENAKGSKMDAITLAARSMLSKTKGLPGVTYRLRAVVTHYGRHENGHYIAYRQHRTSPTDSEGAKIKPKWWRLSDEDVTSVTAADVTDQGGVFMLFYDRDVIEPPTKALPAVPTTNIDLVATKSDSDAQIACSVNPQSSSSLDVEHQTQDIAPAVTISTEETPAAPKIVPKDSPATSSRRRKHKPSAQKDQFKMPMRPMLST